MPLKLRTVDDQNLDGVVVNATAAPDPSATSAIHLAAAA
jgi:hypothetical protein